MTRRGLLDAVVVGAGPVGAALALGLSRDGLAVSLIEAQAPSPWQPDADVDPRVVALAADSIALLDELGVWADIVAARSSPYRRMQVWDAQAPGELVFDAAERGDAQLGAIVENRLIQHVLWQALQQRGSVSTEAGLVLRCPARVVAFEQGDGAVRLELDDGTSLRARMVIAADGAGSGLRELVGIATYGHAYEQRAVVAHVSHAQPHRETAWQRFLPGGPLAFLPLADGRSSIVWSLPDAEASRVLALDDESFMAELGCAFDMRLGLIMATTPRLAFPLRLKLAERYVVGRCILVGDAAHVVHPLAGQGMNLGLRDVMCLRRVIAAAAARGSDIGSAPVLRRYERERRSENTLGAYGFDLIGKLFAPSSLPLAALRGLGLSVAGRIPALRQRLADAAAGRL